MENSLTIRERNKRKRLVGWLLLYLVIIAAFISVTYWQAVRVNTLNFASGQLQLTTSKLKYTVGDNISFTLKNGLKVAISYRDNCPELPLYVYSWVNSTWIRKNDIANNKACTTSHKNHTLNPGESFTESFSAWPNLFSKPGIYRIVALATNYAALPYTDFEVVAKPVPPIIQTRTQVIIQKVYTPVYISVPSRGGGDSGGGDN